MYGRDLPVLTSHIMVPVEVGRGRSSSFRVDEDERSCANSRSSCCAAAMAVKSIEADV